MDNITKGVQRKIRFTVSGNNLNMEDLFALPFSTTGRRLSLDDVAVATNTELQQSSKSFVGNSSAVNEELQLKMDIVLETIAIRKAQALEQVSAVARTNRINELKELQTSKINKQESKRSLESIEEELASLGA